MKITVIIDGKECWYDTEEERKQREFYQQKEKELWDWVFSGRRTVDMFGEEGAKLVLEHQARRDARLAFNHKSRGKK